MKHPRDLPDTPATGCDDDRAAAVAHIAIIGSGPTGIYTAAALLDGGAPVEITMFERSDTAGVGLPYSPEVSSPSMLANIASIEIPPLSRTYLDWLRDRDDIDLAYHGLDRARLDDRTFTPRLLLGAYFRDMLLALRDRAGAAAQSLDIREGCEIVDVIPRDHGAELVTASGPWPTRFDRVVIATGHDFPEEDPRRGYFPSPWSGLIRTGIPATDIGILGTSLSGIDAALAVAMQHGRFARCDRDGLRYDTSERDLRITMMSRNGLLPEADFYCPLPYEPLRVMTPDALDACRGTPDPLDRAFALFAAELAAADPAYARAIGLSDLTADSFADAYFARRRAADPFDWAERNLVEVEHNKANRITVGWRYAILRMHEAMETLVADFPDIDYDRFTAGLKRVFVDNYAAVPSESIRRVLALRRAGVLRIRAIGEDADPRVGADATRVVVDGETLDFPVFIDARGQAPLETADLPFPSLRARILDAGQDVPEVDPSFALALPDGTGSRIHLAAIPYLMRRRPFIQGIAASAEIGAAIGEGVRGVVEAV
ncbi:FAD-NAD(P)-binding protein [Rhodobacterales bacterium HKCCE2091]|nr:FAD-NAD(P)-binding protein [Rhodobacterales bacterium HKCCE2091]